MGDEAEAAADIKTAAKTFGASLVGITAYDARWHYTTKFGRHKLEELPNALLESEEEEAPLPNVIIIGTAMDQTLLETVPSALSGAAIGIEHADYSGVATARTHEYRAVLRHHDSLRLAFKPGPVGTANRCRLALQGDGSDSAKIAVRHQQTALIVEREGSY